MIVDQVVTLIAFGVVLFCVINHVIGADRSDQIDLARAAHRRDFGAESFRDLNGKRADAAGRAIDQDLLPCFNLSGLEDPARR